MPTSDFIFAVVD